MNRSVEKLIAWRKRSQRLCPVSKKRVSNASERMHVRYEVFQRDGWTCQFVHPDFGPCWGNATVHQVKKASQGGTYTPDNLITACQFHNDLMESDADAAALAVQCGLVERRS